MLVSRHQNKRRSRYLIIANKYFKTVSNFEYFGTSVANKSYIYIEIKSRLNSGNARYHLVQNLLSFRLVSINFKIKIYKL
jgi:hypothetical protein